MDLIAAVSSRSWFNLPSIKSCSNKFEVTSAPNPIIGWISNNNLNERQAELTAKILISCEFLEVLV